MKFIPKKLHWGHSNNSCKQTVEQIHFKFIFSICITYHLSAFFPIRWRLLQLTPKNSAVISLNTRERLTTGKKINFVNWPSGKWRVDLLHSTGIFYHRVFTLIRPFFKSPYTRQKSGRDFFGIEPRHVPALQARKHLITRETTAIERLDTSQILPIFCAFRINGWLHSKRQYRGAIPSWVTPWLKINYPWLHVITVIPFWWQNMIRKSKSMWLFV